MLKRKIGVGMNSSDANTYGETLPKKWNVLVTSVLTFTLFGCLLVPRPWR
jgi:hypothetical protein